MLVKLTLRKPKFPYQDDHLIGWSQNGMLFLDAEFEVHTGSYTGLKIWERLALPQGMQHAGLSDGQRKACNISGSKIKGILNAIGGIHPKDDSPQAKRKRILNTWFDLDGKMFPVVVGIASEPTESANGKTYWNNTISRIVTPDNPAFKSLMDGGEDITDGPITGKGSGNGRSQSRTAPQHAASPSDDAPPFSYGDDYGQPYPSGVDDVPF
ncbi:MAG: hypothetical protein LBQ51_04550 [Desulfovibrio sp.]|nr:hypothetical protein [Desulfovibrio sp.]